MLNRIAVSDGSYRSWLETVYTGGYTERTETPIYCGGSSAEIVFQEVVSTSARLTNTPHGLAKKKDDIWYYPIRRFGNVHNGSVPRFDTALLTLNKQSVLPINVHQVSIKLMRLLYFYTVRISVNFVGLIFINISIES